MDKYTRTYDGYYIVEYYTDTETPTSNSGVVINIKSWYPAWLVRLVVRYKLSRSKS
jgi:hypothetical protein